MQGRRRACGMGGPARRPREDDVGRLLVVVELLARVGRELAIAERAEGGYRVTGRKVFCSQAPVMGRAAGQCARHGDCSVGGQADGLKIVEIWDTTGMRATASHDVVVEAVWVPDAAVGARLPADGPMRYPALARVAWWFLCVASSVYLGVAEEARPGAYRRTHRRDGSGVRYSACSSGPGGRTRRGPVGSPGRACANDPLQAGTPHGPSSRIAPAAAQPGEPLPARFHIGLARHADGRQQQRRRDAASVLARRPVNAHRRASGSTTGIDDADELAGALDQRARSRL